MAMATKRRLVVWVAGAAALAWLVSCKPKDVDYGDPVGISLDAKGAVPGLDIAVAVTKGRDVTPTVSSLAGGMYAAAAGCPAFLAAVGGGKLVRLKLSAEANVLHAPSPAPTEEAGSCMVHALDGKAITMDRPDKLDVLVEVTAKRDSGRR